MVATRPGVLGSLLIAGSAAAQTVTHETRGRDGLTVVDRIPHAGPGLAATAPSRPAVRTGEWQQMTVPPNVFIRAISMGSRNVGFAAAELGIVLRTTDGGNTWQTILNQGFPYYWYGVHAFNAQTVIITGFNNTANTGVFRWSDDGGNSWGPIQTLSPPNGLRWLYFVNFADAQRGVIQGAIGTHYTTNGGRTAADWTYVEPGPNWFQGPFTFLPDQRVWMTGYDNFRSSNGGATWSPLPRANPVFDGPHHFNHANFGFIGGGSISPTVAGWLYASGDGGSSWTTQPILQTPYPLRAITQIPGMSWAVGGNYFGNVGGIWGTAFGNWELEQNTGAELVDIQACEVQAQVYDIYAAGMVSQIWRKRVAFGCYANCDPGGAPPVLNVADFTCFLFRYAAGDPYANCDLSTAPPILNVADFTCFLQRYAAGCP